jgi:hypothetical protein
MAMPAVDEFKATILVCHQLLQQTTRALFSCRAIMARMILPSSHPA